VPAAAVILLAACAVGAPFVRPPADAIRLGETTRAQVIALLGPPKEEERIVVRGKELRGITYLYAGDTEPSKVPGTLGLRQLGFVLADDVVVGEIFLSSFASDHSDFDESRVGEIVKGTTTCDAVMRKFGRPGWRVIPPATEHEGDALVIAYTFKYMKRPVLQFKSFEKSLAVRCDSSGVVREVSYGELGDR
jgi:hypothetical protein